MHHGMIVAGIVELLIVVIVTSDPGVLISSVASLMLELAWTGLMVSNRYPTWEAFEGLAAVIIILYGTLMGWL